MGEKELFIVEPAAVGAPLEPPAKPAEPIEISFEAEEKLLKELKVGDRVQVVTNRNANLCGKAGEILKVAADLALQLDKGMRAVVVPIEDVVKVDEPTPVRKAKGLVKVTAGLRKLWLSKLSSKTHEVLLMKEDPC